MSMRETSPGARLRPRLPGRRSGATSLGIRTASEFFNLPWLRTSSVDRLRLAALDVARGALYHYVANKEDLLFQCYLRSIDLTEQVLDANEAKAGPRWILRPVSHRLR